MVPFTPNISQLSQMVDVTRTSLINYLRLLEKSHSVLLLRQEATGIRQMVKPEKIYLQNTNYNYALSAENPEIGNLRETFSLINYNKITKLHIPKKQIFVLTVNIILKLAVKTKLQSKSKI